MPETDNVSRRQTQRATAATHGLESRGQASSAGFKHSEPRQPLTNWRAEDRRRQQASNTPSHGSHSLSGEPRTGVVSRLQTQRATAATHSLESRGQPSSAGFKHSEPRQPLTNWRAEDRRRQQASNTPSHGSHSRTGEPRTGVVSRLQTQRATAATHELESRGQASSAGFKHSESRQPLTSWRAEDRRRQQASNTPSHGSHSPTGEPRTGVVSRLQRHRATAATHQLESRGQASSAGFKHTESRQPLTPWRAEDRRRQQASNTASHGSHSLTGEPRIGVVSRLQTQRATAATHSLESRGQPSSAGFKHSEPRQPLTLWRAEDSRRQQASNTANHGSHSRTGEPRTGVVSRPQTQRATAATHFLESRGQASSAGFKHTEPRQPLTNWLQTHRATAATHFLESRGQPSSAGFKHSEPRQPLTNWRAEDRRRQQASNTPSHGSHSRTGEPRTGVVSRLQTHRATAATHFLESRGQASSAGFKHSESRQPLTSWRAEDRRRQQASNTANHGSHSPTGEPRTGVVSRLQTQRATAATHFLESRGQASSAGFKHSEPRQPLTDWRAEDSRCQQC
ncbi:hypothetical protein EDB86DRAFT_3248286 [Lactarius hatsudake]|nr:hypothetical protein EDB86DRAFT_3248286 [Lactarius hatsudake]